MIAIKIWSWQLWQPSVILLLQWVQLLKSRARLVVDPWKLLIFLSSGKLCFTSPLSCAQGVLSDVLKCLGDNKKHMREATLTALDAWLAAVHFDKMVCLYPVWCSYKQRLTLYDRRYLFVLQIPYVTLALVDNKLSAEGRKDLLEWLSRKLSGINDSSDSIQLLKPACSALTVPY